ncbi:ABC-F family ATP-binding cassette domain-containing protein [Devosia rhodophyticola]|uniref:ABC-F family ATP-binding cassette domain-containing protein n=1 Tax=Devosia rhodophyticola TaxID=3026423 RepID=A0ABY7YVZ6_9HYPH|nr:ABC-F family ATP-binding cassette domain-containing protein [Devosia rhodophyticola]WDR05419.1 ABC-F family ATP-binding cassette domain-containing protein [Devosia rhodophyticola]
MPASITIKNLAYATPDGHRLFDGLDLSFTRQRTGLIGRNGVGKSTLLQLILGEHAPASGAIATSGTLGILRQTAHVDDATVADLLCITPDLARLARLEAGTGTLEDAANADWTLPDRMAAATSQIGLADITPQRPLSSLSGGQRTRLAMAALILARPDFILLDEPTNNLDADGRAALSRFLANWRGGAIIVSHDRSLLTQMDSIVELTAISATTYGGNWHHYAERKAIELAARQHDLATADRELAQIDRKRQVQTERNDRKSSVGARLAKRGGAPRILLGARKNNAENTSAENARLAGKQRQEATSKLEAARSQVEIMTPLSVTLTPTNLPGSKTVITCAQLSGGPDPDTPIINELSFSLIGPERVAITGQNGVGKSTLLRLLTGQLTPNSGSATIHCRFALLDQVASVLDPRQSIRDNFRALNPEDDENACRAALARFSFRADAALQIVDTLSGGELLRAALAATIGGGTPPQLLILDEPTNHLDLTAIEAVESGLRGYDGALVIVSHDRTFLENIGIDREIALTGW